jgi:hypothetical protein
MLSKWLPRPAYTRLALRAKHPEEAQEDATIPVIRPGARASADIFTGGEIRCESYSDVDRCASPIPLLIGVCSLFGLFGSYESKVPAPGGRKTPTNGATVWFDPMHNIIPRSGLRAFGKSSVQASNVAVTKNGHR